MMPPTEGLSFPLPAEPAPGTAIEVVSGVHWLSTLLPGRPRTINLWLLRDGDSWTMVDCGFPLAVVREQIEAAWSATLGTMPLRRLIVTHHHPDHVGNCRWICDRWGIVPTMTRAEHALATTMMGPSWAEWSSRRSDFWQLHGLSEVAAMEFHRHSSRHRELYEPLPKGWQQIGDGNVIWIGDSGWRIIVAEGHAPEQALLYSSERNLLISGDQILPRTTPNISLNEETTSDPVALFLESNRRVAQICAEPLVLPSHNLPYLGLRARIETLARLRRERLAKIESELRREPQTAAALVPHLFGGLHNSEIGFAMGEVIAQLQHLQQQGRAQRIPRNGTLYFAARTGGPQAVRTSPA